MTNKMQYLVEGISKDIVCYLMEDDGISMQEALLLLHNSELFSKLCMEQSGLYIQSSAYVYHIFRSELKYGVLKNS